eukprot:UN11508
MQRSFNTLNIPLNIPQIEPINTQINNTQHVQANQTRNSVNVFNNPLNQINITPLFVNNRVNSYLIRCPSSDFNVQIN